MWLLYPTAPPVPKPGLLYPTAPPVPKPGLLYPTAPPVPKPGLLYLLAAIYGAVLMHMGRIKNMHSSKGGRIVENRINCWMFGCRNIGTIVLVIISIFVYNEYLIYYVLIYATCEWPALLSSKLSPITNVLMLTDTHLLGPRRGHWFDKLRREWQMYRSFQTAVSLMRPDAVFILGDLFDEGTISNEKGLIEYINRFNELFHVPKNIPRHCILGNHDIGFHDEINPARLHFLSERFSRSYADHIIVNDNHFVLLNSMTVERDGCPLCIATENELEALKQKFDCFENQTCSVHSRPILLLHIPLYRESDAKCPNDYDSAPKSIKSNHFYVGTDCLSNESSRYILDMLKPRAVFDGHTHYSCRTWWPSPYSMYEWTLPSFSWRNIRQPAFLLVSLTPENIQVNKCFLPNEKTVILNYIVTATGLLLFLLYQLVTCILWYWRSYSSYQILTQKCD